MTAILRNYDWQTKLAAQVVDDAAVEKAFADQAYGFIANKAGIIMKDPYQLGFEVVSKNDANTRMVGIFAFRLNDDLLYAPAFFLNGEIKGTDLLYRFSVKRFYPNTEDWIVYFREFGNRDMGKGIDRTESRRAPTRMHLERLAYPPHLKSGSEGGGDWQRRKAASDSNLPEEFTLVKPDWAPLLEEMFASSKSAADHGNNLLQSFLEEHGNAKIMDKLASMVEASPDFAEALYGLPEGVYLPPKLKVRLEKEATVAIKSASSEEDLVLFVGMHSECIKSGTAEKVAEKGYHIDDRRAEDVLSLVYADFRDEMTQISNPGVYDVLLANGDMKKALVVNYTGNTPGDVPNSGNCAPVPCSNYSGKESTGRKNVVILEGTPYCHQVGVYESAVLWGALRPEDGDLTEDTAELLKEMKTGKSYLVVNLSGGTASNMVRCVSKATRKGITDYKIRPEYSSGDRLLVHNPDLPDSDLAAGVLGRTIRFVEVADEKCGEDDYAYHILATADHKLGGDAEVMRRALTPGLSKRAAVQWKPLAGEFDITFDKMRTEPLTRLEAAVKLARDLYIRASLAEEILDEAITKGASHFLVWPPEGVKRAAAITPKSDPVWREDMDPVFGIASRSPERLSIGMNSITDVVPTSRIGDAADLAYGGHATNADRSSPEEGNPGMPMEMLRSMSPDNIAQYAQQNELSQVFPHATLGSLLDTYDAASAMDQYLPGMEQGVDLLGRSLFLFYWKPSDFEQAYGGDDMRSLEDRLLSNFKSFGELVLDLLRKTKKRKANGPI